jgi:hypothetical protein
MMKRFHKFCVNFNLHCYMMDALPASLSFLKCGGCGAAADEEYRAALVAGAYTRSLFGSS